MFYGFLWQGVCINFPQQRFPEEIQIVLCILLCIQMFYFFKGKSRNINDFF